MAKVEIYQSPTIGRGWWWKYRVDENSLFCYSGYSTTRKGAERKVRKLHKKLKQSNNKYELELN